MWGILDGHDTKSQSHVVSVFCSWYPISFPSLTVINIISLLLSISFTVTFCNTYLQI